MGNNFKNLFESNIYQSFEDNLNFFSHFNITVDDLNNAFVFMDKGYDDPEKLMQSVEANIHKMLNLLIGHKKDANGKYTVPVAESEIPVSKAYVTGMFFTAIRLLSQEGLYVIHRDVKSLAKINIPKVDDFDGKYRIEEYRYGLRTFLEGIAIWFYRIVDNTNEVRDVLINHNNYFDKGLFKLHEYRNLFVWIWIWSQLRVVIEFHDFEKQWDDQQREWPEIEHNCLKPFHFYINAYEKEHYHEIKDDIYKLTMWREELARDEYEEMYENAQQKIRYDEELTYEEYLKVVDSIKNTFNYYAAFFLDGYFDTLIETIKEHHHIVMDEEKLKTIVHSLLFDIDSLRGSDYGRDFYATGLFHSPLLTLKDLYGKPVIIGYPEIIELSRRLNQIYDFPNTPTNEKIKSVMEMDFKKFLVKQIERTDRRYNVRYFKYQNKFEYELGNEKKDKMVTQYDQVAFDIGSNYLFFCDEFFFRNEPILWAEWKNDVKMFIGNESYSNRFVKRKILPVLKNMKRIKKDFAIDGETKLIYVIFTNLFFNHPSKYEVNGITYYVINYTEVNYFLKTMVFKKDQSSIKFEFNNINLEDELNKKHKAKKKK
jgi:hypothetical protein